MEEVGVVAPAGFEDEFFGGCALRVVSVSLGWETVVLGGWGMGVPLRLPL